MLIKNYISKILFDDINNICTKYLSNIRNKTILITGATGFIPYYIVISLLQNNDINDCNNKIVLLYRNEDKAISKYGELLLRNDIIKMKQDVCDKISMSIKCDYIIHAASKADAFSFNTDPIGVYNANVIGTNNLLDYANRIECESFLYISSFTVYGNIDKNLEIISEEYKFGGLDWNSHNTCYAQSKRGGELLCQCYFHQKQVPIKIIRPGFIYGPSEKGDNRVYAEIIRNVSKEKDIKLNSNGHVFRSMCYVTDVVRAIFAVLFNGKDGEMYNVSSEFVSIREFAHMATEISKKSKLLFEKKDDEFATPPKVKNGEMINNKIKIDCNWENEISINNGIFMSIQITKEDL